MPIPVQPRVWWRMPEAEPRKGGVRRPEGWWRLFLPYWAAALALAYGIHVDLVPVRHWLAMSAAAEPAPTEPRAPGVPLPPVGSPVAPRDGEPEPARPMALTAVDVDRLDAEVEEGEGGDPGRRDSHDEDDGGDTSARSEAGSQPSAREPESEDFSHLWAVEDPVLTRPPEPEPSPRVIARTEARDEPSRASSSSKSAPDDKREVRRRGGSSAGESCEAAVAAYRERVTMGDDSVPADISAARYGAVLNRGSYFSHCGVPDSTAIHICAAVQNGRAVGVTVTTTPRNRAIERCVAGAVRGLSFPSHPRMDVTRTTFE